MTYLTELRQSRSRPAVIFQEFATVAPNKQDYLFCFFEGASGADNPYYIPRIMRHTSDYYPIRCAGKENVLKAHEIITGKPEYQSYKKAFFIDRDFDPPISSSIKFVFETPCYSIENLYSSSRVFSDILISHFGLSISDPDYAACMSIFNKLQSEYHQATLLFNSWYSLLIDYRNLHKTNIKAQLEDKIPTNFVRIQLSGVSSHYTLSDLEAAFPNAPKIPQADVNLRISQFSQQNMCEVFRGKFELSFVCRIIELLVEDSKNAKTIIKANINLHHSTLTVEQAISILSCYAETPTSLIAFLSNY